MRISKIIFLLILFFLFIPKISLAESCLRISAMAYKDVKYSGNILRANQFQWMDLSWLTRNLGKVKPRNMGFNRFMYHWDCHSASGAYFTVIVNNSNQVVAGDGLYSSDAGAYLFRFNVAP